MLPFSLVFQLVIFKNFFIFIFSPLTVLSPEDPPLKYFCLLSRPSATKYNCDGFFKKFPSKILQNNNRWCLHSAIDETVRSHELYCSSINHNHRGTHGVIMRLMGRASSLDADCLLTCKPFTGWLDMSVFIRETSTIESNHIGINWS